MVIRRYINVTVCKQQHSSSLHEGFWFDSEAAACQNSTGRHIHIYGTSTTVVVLSLVSHENRTYTWYHRGELYVWYELVRRTLAAAACARCKWHVVTSTRIIHMSMCDDTYIAVSYL